MDKETNLLKAKIKELEKENLLLQTHQNYETFFNTINDFLFVLDEQANIIHTNSTVINRLGYTREELAGNSVLMVHPADRREEAGRIVDEILKGTAEFCPVPLITKSGKQIPVETRVRKGIWNGKPAIFGVTTDVSKIALSEEKFSKVFYLNPSACGLNDVETGKYVEVNDAFYSLLGFDKNEVIGKTASELGILTQEVKSSILHKFGNSEVITNAEADLRTKSGDIKHVLLSAENIIVQDKKLRYTVVQDITERKKAEQEIQNQNNEYAALNEEYKSQNEELNVAKEKAEESEEKYRTMMEYSNDMIWTLDGNGNFQFLNKIALESIGLSLSECIGTSFVSAIIEEDLPMLMDVFQKNMNGIPCKYELRLKKQDNTSLTISVNTSPIYVSDNIVGVVSFGRNITEQKRAEQALENRNAMHHAMIENIGDVIGIMGVDGIMKYKSPNIEKYFGWKPEDLVGKDGWHTVYPEDIDRLQKAFYSLLQKDNSSTIVEYRYMCKDGSYKWIELTAVNNTNNPLINGVLLNYHDITERKQAEKALRKSEERFNMAITGTGAGLWDWDMVNDTVYFSPQWKAMLGYEDHEIENAFSGWKKLWHPDDVAKIEEVLKDYLDEKTTKYEIEHRLRHKDGDWRWILTRGDIIKDSDGKPSRWVGTNLDITERKLIEKTLQESEDKYRTLFTHMSEGFALHEIIYNSAHKAIDYKILNINTAFTTQISIPEEKANGALATQLYGVSPAPFLDIYSRVAETGESHSFQTCFPPLNKYFDISVFSPKLGYFATIFTDITERKHAEEQIIQLSQAVKQSPATIVITDLNGDIEYVNPKFTATTGYSVEEALGKNPRILKSGELPDEQYKILWDTITSGKEWVGEFHNKKKNGELYWELASISPIINKEGIITHFLAVKEEITERKLSEIELKKSETQLQELNVTKDKLFSIIAHDLRSPFNSILGFSELLLEDREDYDVATYKMYSKQINSSAQNTLVLLDNLLNWAKSQTGQINFKPEKVVLSCIIQEIFELSNSSAKNKNIVLNYIQSEEIIVFADLNMIKTILRNLISNAIKFTNSNGKIDVYALQNDNFIEIAVSDNGVGMNEETRNKLFSLETNETTLGTANEKGSGLGLLLCKEFVEKHDGKIWIESEEGKGSIFYFTLPYQTETIIESSVIKEILLPVEDASINKLKILIAEDDEISDKLLSITVRKLGKEIINVKTGKEAVEACQNNPDIDLVLMDILMPEMDGYEATRQIRKFNKDVIIIAQTAYALSGDYEKAIAAGCNDYISKPINANELKQKINKVRN